MTREDVLPITVNKKAKTTTPVRMSAVVIAEKVEARASVLVPIELLLYYTEPIKFCIVLAQLPRMGYHLIFPITDEITPDPS